MKKYEKPSVKLTVMNFNKSVMLSISGEADTDTPVLSPGPRMDNPFENNPFEYPLFPGF